jgi:DNA-binding LacI/PurR family transcriptional regulator
MTTKIINEQDKQLSYDMPLTPRQKDVYQLLLDYISEKSLKEGDKLPSFKDIAQELGISLKIIQTVISLMNRDGVVQAVPYVGTFIPRKKKTAASAAAVKTFLPENSKPVEKRREKRVALIIPWNIPEVMDNIQQLFQDAGIGLLTFFTPQPNATATKMQLLAACSHGVDGIIFFNSKFIGNQDCVDLLERIRHNGIHVITVDAVTPKGELNNSFYLGCEDAFRELCIHLKSQRYQQVHYVTANNSPDERENLFAELAVAHGLLNGPRICTSGNEIDQTIKSIGKESLPVLYCDGDFAAIECLKHLRGWKNIPDEIGLVASVDMLIGNKYRLGELLTPTLTTLQFPFATLAEKVVLAMIADINLGRMTTLSESSECVPISLIVRESTHRI